MLLGSLFAGGFFFILALIGGMGGGDVKLIAVGGLFLGYPKILVGVIVSLVLGAVVGVGLILLGIKKRKDKIPFGPFIALGIIITSLWYLDILALIY